MSPAAADTIRRHLRETGRDEGYYDLIVTGDLGALGSRILKDLLWEKGVDIQNNHVDCGEVVYKVIEDEFQGGSGAGCSAVVFNSYIFDKLKKRGMDFGKEVYTVEYARNLLLKRLAEREAR